MEDTNEPDRLKSDNDSLEDDDQTSVPIDTEEEALDLTDFVDNSSGGNEEEILELTDMVEVSSDSVSESVKANVIEFSGMNSDVSDDVESVSEYESGDDGLEDDFNLPDELVDELDDDSGAGNDIINSLGVDLTSEIDVSMIEAAALIAEDQKPDENDDHEGNMAQSGLPVSKKELENAIEHVIIKLYSEKIEGIIIEAIEKAVQKEIEKLNVLLKDVLGNVK